MSARLEECSFWMDGLLARNALEITHDPADLQREGFWAVMATFEGEWTCVRFAEVLRMPFPAQKWNPIAEPWTSNFDQRAYMRYVEEIRELISAGEVYQVNACRQLSANHIGSLAGLFSEIQNRHHAPYAAYFKSPEIEIASASPELFLKIEGEGRNRYATSSPIKGTATTPDFGLKDSAENIMIVDLIRNDLGRICEPGSIEVPRLLGIEEHPGLFHLVSDVRGKLKPDISWKEIAEAVLPAGSISGAPKSSAIKVIQGHESTPRGPYCGVLGWVNGEQAQLSVGIRLFWKENADRIHFGSGAGITWASDASAEWDETELKAARLMDIAHGKMQL